MADERLNFSTNSVRILSHPKTKWQRRERGCGDPRHVYSILSTRKALKHHIYKVYTTSESINHLYSHKQQLRFTTDYSSYTA